jgi:C-terminal processing protease CtpA/Prc
MLRVGRVLVVVVVAALVLFVLAAMYRDYRNGPVQDGIERDLGFRIGTPYVDGREVITIESVVPGKPMARADVQSHDILVAPHYGDTRDLFDDLNRARGGTFAMTVERDGKRVEAVVAVPRRPTGVATQPVRGRSAP